MHEAKSCDEPTNMDHGFTGVGGMKEGTGVGGLSSEYIKATD